MSLRIAVFGSGGVGGYFGARLAAAGCDVAFIARGDHLQALRANGLRVSSVLGDCHLSKVQASQSAAEIGTVDFILLGLKSWQIEDAAVQLQPLLGPTTTLVTMQNGVDAPDILAEHLGQARILPGLVKLFTRVVAPGCIEHIGGPGSITFGEWSGAQSDRVTQLEAAFVQAGVPVIVSRDIRAALWEKLLFVAAMGAVGSVSRAPIGILRSMPQTRQVLEQCMVEIAAAARAEGVALAPDIVERTLRFIDAQPAAGKSSLQRDIAAGKPSELEAWLGGVVRRASRSGVSVPLCSQLYHLLLPLERRARGEVEFAD